VTTWPEVGASPAAETDAHVALKNDANSRKLRPQYTRNVAAAPPSPRRPLCNIEAMKAARKESNTHTHTHTHTKAGWLDYDPVTLVLVIGMIGLLH
jgi:hypothetical protein